MMVPSTLPNPPMITMANAFTITLVPANGVNTRMGPSIAPPMPASPQAITNVSVMSALGLMPISPAVSRSWATARSALPRNVNFMNAYSSAMVNAETRTMMTFCQVMKVPPQSRITWLLYGLSNA